MDAPAIRDESGDPFVSLGGKLGGPEFLAVMTCRMTNKTEVCDCQTKNIEALADIRVSIALVLISSEYESITI